MQTTNYAIGYFGLW